MIKISHILYSKRAIGIATHKMKSGDNKVQITAKRKDGSLYYPEPFTVNKDIAVAKYGPIEKINGKHSSLMGIFIPLRDIEEGVVNEINNKGDTPAQEK